MLLIQRNSDTPIRPRDVDSDNAFHNTFGKREAEIAAYWIVRYCQARKSWSPFHFAKLAQFCTAHDPRSSNAYSYLEDGVSALFMGQFVSTRGKVVTLTTAFVARCYGTAPVQGLPRKRRKRLPKKPVLGRLERLLSDEDCVA